MTQQPTALPALGGVMILLPSIHSGSSQFTCNSSQGDLTPLTSLDAQVHIPTQKYMCN